MAGGYADDRIPGEGTINDYLSVINWELSASCLELYVRDCEDASEAFDKIKEKLINVSVKDRPEVFLNITAAWGIAHREKDGKQYFVVILMRYV